MFLLNTWPEGYELLIVSTQDIYYMKTRWFFDVLNIDLGLKQSERNKLVNFSNERFFHCTEQQLLNCEMKRRCSATRSTQSIILIKSLTWSN